MTCDVCGRPERAEHLRDTHTHDRPPRIVAACRRCRLPEVARAHWDAMHSAENLVIANPDDPNAIAILREYRQGFDRALHGRRATPRRRPAP